MLFKVTHIDAAGHCHRATLPARNVAEAMDMADQQWGDAQRMACVRLPMRPDLHLVHPAHQHQKPQPKQGRTRPCVS